jgi:hypothetical protein
MKGHRFVVLILVLFILSALVQGADEAKGAEAKKKQPVLVLLYSRFDDHINIGVGEDRLFRLLNLVEKLRKEYPSYPISVSCEFSGTFAEELTKTPTGKGYIDRLKRLADAGAVYVGYIGENEPTYRNRPKVLLTKQMTAEQRWLEQTNAAESFLNDFKDPLTGEPTRGRPGGLLEVQKALGDPVILGTFAPKLGGEAPYFHQLLRMNLQPIVPGFPDPYFTMNIHGYRLSAVTIGSKSMVPVPEASSELFWDTNFLRASFTSTNDIRQFNADEGKESLTKLIEKLDRSRVRLLQIEVVGYSRYLNKWPDGTPKLHPLVWAYDHPEAAEIPNGIRAFLGINDIEKSYASEEEVLRWLLTDFLPANARSKVVNPRELLKMAKTPVGTDVSAKTLKEAANDWIARSKKEINMSPTYVQAGGTYLSAADLFQLLANSLAVSAQGQKPPEKVRLTHIYGPILLEEPESTTPSAVVTAGEVARVAATLTPKLNDQTWRPVPWNAVPSKIEIAGQHVNPAQFLALMVEAYLAPSQDTPIKLRYFLPLTAPGYFFPRQTETRDGGHMWTLRPAVLRLE